MDALAGLLDGPRARSAFLLRTVMEPPWSLRIEDGAPLTAMAVTSGPVHVACDDGSTASLAQGDVVLLRGPGHYVVADTPGRSPNWVIDERQVCTTLAGAPPVESMAHGVRTWGNDPAGSCVLLVGTYLLDGEVSRRVLSALPSLVALPGEHLDTPLVALLDAEIARDAPGQEAILDRLLDLLVVTALRAFLASDPSAPGWFRAEADPVVGPALALIHHRPEQPWTVATLAAVVGISRAALARRFTELVGEPPMSFLTGWRLALAADLVREPGATLDSVAARVGYSSAFALSAAFKRVRGVSPQEHRRRSAS